MRISIVDRYTARSFLVGYAILMFAGIGLYVLSDLLVNIDEFTEDKSLSAAQMLASAADYYGYNIPLYFAQLTGPIMAFAAAFTLAMMLRNNEMTALASAGMPLTRLAVPIVVCSTGLIGLWVLNHEFVLPKIAPKIVRPRGVEDRQRTIGVECARDDRNSIVNAARLYPREGRMFGVTIIEPDEFGKPAALIEARSATYDPDRRTWLLEAGRRITFGDPLGSDGQIRIHEQPLDEYRLLLDPDELVLRRSAEWADFLALADMRRLLRSRNLPFRNLLLTSFHIRLTTPLLQLIMLTLVLPFFLTREPTNVLAAGGKALLLGGAMFGAAFVAKTIVKTEFAALYAWLPILIFGPIAVVRLSNAKT